MKHLIFSVSLLFSWTFLVAQNAQFSQYNTSRTYTNPAFTGTDSTLVISTGDRMQWTKIDGGYKTFYFSADQYVHFLRGGLGINYLNDNEGNGTIITSRIDINFASHFELFKHKLVVQPAISTAYFQKKINWGKLTFGDMIDERRGFVYNTNEVQKLGSRSGIDFSAGLLVYSTDFYGGIAAHHFTEPNEGFLGNGKLPLKLTFHTGANLRFNTKNFILSPNILLMKQQDFQMLLPGVGVKYKWAVVGVSYRSQDAFIINAGFQNRFLKIAYSYDYTVSSLTNKATGGSHEIQLVWFFHYQKKVCKIKTLRLI